MSKDFAALNPFLGQQQAAVELTLDYMEKAVALQLDLLQGYSESTLQGLRGLLSPETGNDLPGYLRSQQARSNEFVQRLGSDLERISGINQAYLSGLSKLAEAPQGKPAKKAA